MAFRAYDGNEVPAVFVRRAEVRRCLHSLGCQLTAIEKGKHYKARFTYQGRSHMLVFSGTSRDANLEKNMVQDVKSIIRRSAVHGT